MKAVSLVLALFALVFVASAQEASADYDTHYVFAAASAVVPSCGGRVHRTGGAGLGAGWYATEFTAFELEAADHANRAFFAARWLAHFSACDKYNELFGYERTDPFLTLGAAGWTARGEVGPSVGLGTYYHLTDRLSLRVASEAVFGCDGRRETPFVLSAGLRYSF